MPEQPSSGYRSLRPADAGPLLRPPGTGHPHDIGHSASGFDLKPDAWPLPGYKPGRCLGRGGFGAVWQATGPGDIDVALKFIRLDDKAGAVEQRGLDLIKNLRHAHLLSCFGAWQRDGFLIVAMELAEGSLLDRLNQARQEGLDGIPRDDLVEYLLEAAKGIDYLNARQIQHRDVKPHNLLLLGGSVKVADFGLAKLLQHTVTSNSGAMTVAYAAPEFFRTQTSDWSDQYSLAATYVHLRTGALLFSGDECQVMYGHLNAEPDLGKLPKAERPVVARALAKEPKERWPSCRKFVEALAACTQGSGRVPSVKVETPPPALVLKVEKAAVTVLAGKKAALTARVDRQHVMGAVMLEWTGLPDKVRGRAVPLADGEASACLELEADDDAQPASAHEACLQARLGSLEAGQPVFVTVQVTPRLRLSGLRDVTLKAGEQQTLEVQVERKHCLGPVELQVAHLPKGVRLGRALVSANRDRGALELLADADAPNAEAAMLVRAEGAGASTEQRFSLTVVPRPKEPEKEIVNTIGVRLVLIPPGRFLMGSPDADREAFNWEKPQHEVEITRPFYLGKHAVTRGQFRKFVQETGYKTGAETDGQGGWGFNAATNRFEGRKPFYSWRNAGFEQTDEHPVISVTWNDAVAFCDWLSKKEGGEYRLPTEAEWEFSCRANTTTRFWSGDTDESLRGVANIADASFKHKYAAASKWAVAWDDGYPFTALVGRFKPNGFGLCDMHGNVWEWCQDWYGEKYYQDSPAKDPQGPSAGSCRVLRGGSFLNEPRYCRSAQRERYATLDRGLAVGFRVVRVR
jgi:formylglycine-generating enzyme